MLHRRCTSSFQTGKQVDDGSSQTLESRFVNLRMIANAAGGLLPSSGRAAAITFHANVLPSYGMTECMPISSPPAYNLEKPGTSGVAVGPEIAILNTSTVKSLPPGEKVPSVSAVSPAFADTVLLMILRKSPARPFEGWLVQHW
jgi:acyl-CoA synthetase (AMP-forming)/AMP-acid ligase II